MTVEIFGWSGVFLAGKGAECGAGRAGGAGWLGAMVRDQFNSLVAPFDLAIAFLAVAGLVRRPPALVAGFRVSGFRVSGFRVQGFGFRFRGFGHWSGTGALEHDRNTASLIPQVLEAGSRPAAQMRG